MINKKSTSLFIFRNERMLLIKHKIWIGFGVILALLLIIATLSIVNINKTKQTINTVVVESQPILILAQLVSAHLGNAHSAVGNFLITGDDQDRQVFQNEMQQTNKSIDAMAELDIVKKTPKYQEHIEHFRRDLGRYQSYESQLFGLSKNLEKNKPAIAFASANLNPLVSDFLSLIYQMIESESDEEVTPERVEWLNHLHSVRYNMVRLMSTARIFMQSPDEGSLNNVKAELDVIVPVTEKMAIEKFADLYTFEQEEGVPRAIEMMQAYSQGINTLIELNSSPKRRLDAYLYENEATPIRLKIQEELDGLIEHLLSENDKGTKDLLKSVDTAGFMQLILAFIGLSMGIIVAFIISRMITLPLVATVSALQDLAQGEGDLTKRLEVKSKDEIGQLSQAFNEFSQKVQGLIADVANTAMQLSQSASQMDQVASSTQTDIVNQNSQIDMVVNEIETMNIKIQSVVGHSNQAAELAENTNNDVKQGQQVVNQSATSSQQLAQDVDRAAHVINNLESDVETIGGVLDVIRGIAEQTNLLALNAAIEAARAGEQGRGFAVVADEVRTLASRTGESTEEIQKMIERLQTGSKQAVEAMQQGKQKADEGLNLAGQVGDSLHSISSAVHGMLEKNREIASGTEEQGKSAQQVNHNIVSIKSISDQTSQSAQSMASTSSQVMQLAQQLQSLLGQFKI